MTAFSVRPNSWATRPAETHRHQSGGKLPRTLRAAQVRPDALAVDRVFARFHHPDTDREPGVRTRRHLDAPAVPGTPYSISPASIRAPRSAGRARSCLVTSTKIARRECVVLFDREICSGRSNERWVGISPSGLYCYSESLHGLVRSARPTTAARRPIRHGFIRGPDREPSSSASECPLWERPTPSRLLSVRVLHSCARGSAGPSIYSGDRTGSSRKGSWIITISLDRDPCPGGNGAN